MVSVKPNEPWGKLPMEQREEFAKDALAGLSDADLSAKYNLRERTATNWRIRLVGPRHEKGPATPTTDSPSH